jgi:rod shape-determining protein MreB and related proteins
MAVGNAAKAMLGKTPGNIQAIRPLRHGVIADFEITEKMLRYFITKVHDGRAWVKPQVVIAVPVGITAVERRAVIHSAERAGARKVYLIDEPMAAGIGVELPVIEARGSLIVDIGGGTTEIAVLALGGKVVATSLRVGGDEMDETIQAHMRREHSLLIGEQTAERIKTTIGSAWPLEQELSMEVKGRDSITGLPRKVTVTSIEVREALSEPVRQCRGSPRSPCRCQTRARHHRRWPHRCRTSRPRFPAATLRECGESLRRFGARARTRLRALRSR